MRQTLPRPRVEDRLPFGSRRCGGDQHGSVAVGSFQERAVDLVMPGLELPGSKQGEGQPTHPRTSAIALAKAGTARSHMSSFAVRESRNQPGISKTEPGKTYTSWPTRTSKNA